MRLPVSALIIAAVAVMFLPLRAQEVRPEEQVSLRTDEALNILLDVIRESGENKDWQKAFKALAEIERFLKTNGEEYILPVSSFHENGETRVYVSAREAAYRELSKLPENAFHTWRISADKAVRDVIDECKLSVDLEKLEQIAEKYPLSSHTPEVLNLMACAYLERGDIHKSLRACMRALAYFPDMPENEKAHFSFLRIICHKKLDTGISGHLISEFNKKFCDTEIHFKGATLSALDALTRTLEEISPPTSKPPELAGGTGRVKWHKNIPAIKPFTKLLKKALECHPAPLLQIQPAVTDRTVLYSDGAQITSLEAGTGNTLWSYAAASSPISSVIYNSFHRPAVGDGTAATSLGEKLHLFNTENGKLLWSVSPSKVEEESCVYITSPCIVENSVIIGTSSWGKELTCALHAYDIKNGKLRWSTKLITGFPTDTYGLGRQPSPPVIWGDSVFFVTNLGAVVCCDINDGRIIWLNKYTSGDSLLKDDSIKSSARWPLCPPVIHKGVLLTAPQDFPFLFAIDALEGSPLWKEPKTGLSKLLYPGAASNGSFYVAGIQLRRYNCFTGKLEKIYPLQKPAAGPACVFKDRIIVPCHDRLIEFDNSSGMQNAIFHLPETPGATVRIAPFDGGMFLSAPEHVWNLQNLESAKREHGGSQDSDSHSNLIKAEIAWRNGYFSRGLDMLESCYDKTTGDDPLRNGIRKQIFAAAKTASENSTGIDKAHFLKKASEYCETQDAPSVLLKAGQAYEKANAVEKALSLYRDILINQQARKVFVKGHEVDADDFARICEYNLLKDNPSFLQNQEKMAGQLIEQGEHGSGLNHRLFDVIRAFPNTKRASEAYIELGRYCLQEKLLESAELYLNEFLARKQSSQYAAQAKMLLSETYISGTKYLQAKKLLRDLLGVKYKVTYNKKTENAGDYAERRLALPDIAKVNPEHSICEPLGKIWQTTPCLAQQPPDVVGVDGDDTIFLLGNNLLDCRSISTGALQERFDLSERAGTLDQRHSALVWQGGAAVLVCARLVGIETGKGYAKWKWGATLPPPENIPASSPRDIPITSLSGNNILALWPHNRLIAFNRSTGSTAWTFKSSSRYFGPPSELDKNLILVDSDGSSITGLNSETGAVLFTKKLDGRPFSASAVLECSGKLVIIRGSRDIYCLDGNGNSAWSRKGKNFIQQAVFLKPGKMALRSITADGQEIECLNLSDGSKAWNVSAGKDEITSLFADESNLYMSQRPRFGSTSVTALDRDSGKEKWKWSQPAGGYAIINDSSSHLVACVVDRMISTVYIISKQSGAAVQSFVFPAEMLQSGFVADGSLFISTDRSAYRFGSVNPATAREQYANTLYDISRKTVPSDALAQAASTLGHLREYEKAAIVLEEIVRSDWQIPESEIKRLVERAGGYRYGTDRDTQHVIEAQRLLKPGKADGILGEEWMPALAVKRSVDGIFKIDVPRDPAGEWLSDLDLSATYYFGWDKENFYFAVDVKDNVIRPWDKDEEDTWKGDLLLIALDPLGDGGWTARADDLLLSMGLILPRKNLTKEEMEEEERHQPKGEYFVKRRETGGGIVYEARIPWEMFNENGTNINPATGPADGFSFGIELALVDDDTGGGASKTLNLAKGLFLGKRNTLWRGFVPRNFAVIKLKDK